MCAKEMRGTITIILPSAANGKHPVQCAAPMGLAASADWAQALTDAAMDIAGLLVEARISWTSLVRLRCLYGAQSKVTCGHWKNTLVGYPPALQQGNGWRE